MAGGKKKKSSSNPKKNKSRKIKNATAGMRNTPISLDEVLDQAESAMETFDLDGAVTLFTYAKEVLTSRIHAPAPNTAISDGISNDDDRATLSNVLGKLGELQASNGDRDGARKHFLDAIDLMGPPSASNEESQQNAIEIAHNCEKRAGLHLYLGQLSSGMEALSYFRVGVSELERAVSLLEGKSVAGAAAADRAQCEDNMDLDNLQRPLIETRRQLCAAFCSVAELYMTDLCEEPDAESLCEAALNSALTLDEALAVGISESGNGEGSDVPQPPDALQTIANFRLSQCRVPEAAVCILKAYERMKVGCEAMSALVGLSHADGVNGDVDLEAKSRELVDVDAATSLPDYGFRCQTAKIMLECASLLENNEKDTQNQCAESAIQVLGSLLAEDDEVIEVWYLLGCAFMACTPSSNESAHYYWDSALSMLTKAKDELENSLEEDYDLDAEQQLEAIECQITEVKSKLGLDTNKEGEDEESDTQLMQE